MVEKRESRKADANQGRRKAVKKDVALSAMAEGLFIADGKNPYLKGDLAIHNLVELVQNIASLEHHEAPWVADWIQYLGDAETARRIREEPAHFKKIINERWAELKKQFE